MIKPLEQRDPFKLGIGAFAVGIVLALLVLLVTVIPFGKNTYTAVFAQSAGVQPKEDVQVSGVRVGEVRSVKLVGATVHVTFTVTKHVHLGNRSTAAVKVATLLGTHFLAVDPAGSGDLPNDTIPMDRTSVPFNLQDVINEGTPKIEQIDAPKLAKLFTVLTNELQPSTDDVAPALQGVIRLSDVVAHRSDQIGDLLTAARRVTGQLSAGSNDLIGLMKQADLVIDEVLARRKAIHLLLTEATRLATNVNAVIGQTKADIKPALDALNTALAQLRRQDKTLRGVLDTMAPAARYLANATGNAAYGDLYAHPPLVPPDDGCALLGPLAGAVC